MLVSVRADPSLPEATQRGRPAQVEVVRDVRAVHVVQHAQRSGPLDHLGLHNRGDTGSQKDQSSPIFLPDEIYFYCLIHIKRSSVQ